MLKSGFRNVAVIVTTGVFAANAFGQDRPSHTRDSGRDNHPGGAPVPPAVHPSLEHEMGAMNRAYRTIRRQVNDKSKNASTLAAVSDLEVHTLTAKSVLPDSATTKPSPDPQEKPAADYYTQLIDLLKQELTLEQQLRADDNTSAAITVKSLQALEQKGHDEFRPHDND